MIGRNDSIGPVASPNRPARLPSWKIKVTTPNAPAIDSRLKMPAFSSGYGDREVQRAILEAQAAAVDAGLSHVGRHACRTRPSRAPGEELFDVNVSRPEAAAAGGVIRGRLRSVG